jgi:hypothetical protein
MKLTTSVLLSSFEVNHCAVKAKTGGPLTSYNIYKIFLVRSTGQTNHYIQIEEADINKNNNIRKLKCGTGQMRYTIRSRRAFIIS